MKHIKYIAYISLFLLASCSTTKNLPEGEVLYTGIKKIEVTNEDKSKEGEEALTEIEAALAYPPNNALLGVRLSVSLCRSDYGCTMHS